MSNRTSYARLFRSSLHKRLVRSDGQHWADVTAEVSDKITLAKRHSPPGRWEATCTGTLCFLTLASQPRLQTWFTPQPKWGGALELAEVECLLALDRSLVLRLAEQLDEFLATGGQRYHPSSVSIPHKDGPLAGMCAEADILQSILLVEACVERPSTRFDAPASGTLFRKRSPAAAGFQLCRSMRFELGDRELAGLDDPPARQPDGERGGGPTPR